MASEDALKQVVDTWNALALKKKIMAGVAALGALLAIVMLGNLAARPSLSLLYAGLENGAAGEIVRALEQRGVAYEIRGDSIFVPNAQRDELRLTLASEGLPANSTQGYELLDSLTGFGTTSQMFDAAYWRAKEGELARTIVANPVISGARVHIANAQSNPFRREMGATASVFVTTTSGALDVQQAKALRFLISSAVPGMEPEDVSIIDSVGGLIQGADDKVAANVGDEKSLALKDRVTRLIEARVGQGNAVVEVSVETVTESESVRERVLDPASRVAISTDTEELSNNSNEAGGGDVTVASNLPNGDAGAEGQSNSQNSETRERINYEVSETERQITRAPGAIKRLTVAVLVNGQTNTAADGTQEFSPLPDAELESLRELVAAAVGFEDSRGDEITIRSMPFEPTEITGTSATAGFWSSVPFDPLALLQIGVLACVSLILGLFVVRPILMKPPAAPMLALTGGAPSDAPEQSFAGPDTTEPVALTGEIDDGSGQFSPITVADPALARGDNGDLLPRDNGDSVDRLRKAISERREETVEILRGWLDETEEKA